MTGTKFDDSITCEMPVFWAHLFGWVGWDAAFNRIFELTAAVLTRCRIRISFHHQFTRQIYQATTCYGYRLLPSNWSPNSIITTECGVSVRKPNKTSFTRGACILRFHNCSVHSMSEYKALFIVSCFNFWECTLASTERCMISSESAYIRVVNGSCWIWI